MIPTIQRQLRKKTIAPSDLTSWSNFELLPLLAEMRLALNYKAVQSPPTFATEGTGAFTTVWTSADLAVGTAVRLDADVAVWSPAARSAFTITGLFYNNGAVAQEGLTVAGYTQDMAGFDLKFVIVANHIELQVSDNGIASSEWSVVVTAQEAP